VDEHVLAAIVPDDEAEALVRVEELDDALALADDLGRHSAAARGTEASAAAARTRAAEAATSAAAAIAAASAAEAVAAAAITAAAAAEAVATATAAAAEAASFKSAAELVTAADIVALVFAATAALTAAPSVETHLSQILSSAHSPVRTTALGKTRKGLRTVSPAHCRLL
jgi:hypothetical protein